MEKQFEIFRTSRKFLLDYIEDLTTAQLNKVPEGFKNNIIWNLAHMIVAQQGVSYKRGGHAMLIEDEIFEMFKPGSIPTLFIEEAQVIDYKSRLINTINEWERDYNSGLFSQNPAWKQSMGIEVNNIDETISFLMWHDGLHIGMIMSLKKLV